MNRTALRWALGLVLLAAVGVALTQRGRFDAAMLRAWVEGAGAAVGTWPGPPFRPSTL
jgi:hypothetical protein